MRNRRDVRTLIPVLLFLFPLALDAAEVRMVESRMAFIQAGPGAYYPRVDVVRRNAVVEIGGKDESGRWVKVKSYPMSDTGKTKVAALEKESGKAPELWIADTALFDDTRNLDEEKKKLATQALAVSQLQALDSIQAIRGMDEFTQGQMKMLQITPELRNYIERLAFTPEQYLQFKRETIGRRTMPALNYYWNAPKRFDLQGRLLMGNAIALRMMTRYGGPPVTDPALNRYVNMVANFIVDRGPADNLFVRVFIARNDRIMSLSSPGGIVIISDTLIRACKDEAELAAVLAHEIVHVARRHGLLEPELKTKAVGMNIDDMWNALTDKTKKLNNKPDWVQPVEDELTVMSDEFLARTIGRGYALQQETEADAFGVVFLYLAGYDVKAAPEFLSRVLIRQTTSWPIEMNMHGLAPERAKVVISIIQRYGLTSRESERFEPRFKKATAVLAKTPPR